MTIQWKSQGGGRLAALAISCIAISFLASAPAPASAQQGPAALTLDKVGVPDPVAAGGQITYTLTFANTGGADATNAILADPLPANTSFVSATGGASLIGGTLVLWNLGTIPAGGGGSVTLVVQVATPLANGTVISNTATISSDETDPTSATAENTVASAPQLGLSKTDSPDPVAAGDFLTYTLSYSNTGSDQATGAVLTDPLPSGTTFVSASGGGSYDSGTNTVTWSLGTIPAGTSGSVTFLVRVDPATPAGTMLQNTATLDADGQIEVTASSSTTVQQAPPVAQVPTLGGAGLALLALLLAGLGTGSVWSRGRPPGRV